MSGKISNFFKKVDKFPEVDGNSLPQQPKVEECRVIQGELYNSIDLMDVPNELISSTRRKSLKNGTIKHANESTSTTENAKSKSKCEFCDKKYSSLTSFREHMKKCHPDQIKKQLLKCELCDQIFIKKVSLDRHIQVKHIYGNSVAVFECDFDGKTFKTKQNLYVHMKIHLPRVKCSICHVELKKNSMYDHMKQTHATERRFQCKVCPKFFKSLKHLQSHEKVHDKKFSCKICEKRFQNQSILKSHIKEIHENPKSFSCEKCDKKFNTKSNLTIHKNLHDKNHAGTFKCSRCDYGCDSKRDYQNHLNSHQRKDEKFAAMRNPLKCAVCPTLCRNKYILKQHIKNVHPKEKFQCDLCGKYFKTKGILRVHILFHLRHKVLSSSD